MSWYTKSKSTEVTNQEFIYNLFTCVFIDKTIRDKSMDKLKTILLNKDVYRNVYNLSFVDPKN